MQAIFVCVNYHAILLSFSIYVLERFACPQSPLPQSPRQPRPWSGGWGGGEGDEVPHLLLGLFWPLEAAEISTRALRPRSLSLPSPALPAARLTPHHEREWVVFADND